MVVSRGPTDIKGRRCISYMRFSSRRQSKGDSIRRQEQALADLIERFDLVVDQTLIDRARSATKKEHIKFGQLGVLLRLIADRLVEPGVVLVIESISRLVRENLLDVFPTLKQIIIDGKMILVTSDGSIWDEYTINSPAVHKLIAEINAASEYTRTLADYASSAHARRRERLLALNADPNAPAPRINAIPPAWIMYKDGRYVVEPDRAALVVSIFRMVIDGRRCIEIAQLLNDEGVSTFAGPRRAELWTGPRVGALIRDERVLGRFQPHQIVGGKRQPVGPQIDLYPAIVDATMWIAAGEALDGRLKLLRGRFGDRVANLFTGHVFCRTCGAAMRVSNAGRTTGYSPRKFVCARYLENRACHDSQRYDLDEYEHELLVILSLHAAPAKPPADTTALAEEIAQLKLTIDGLEKSAELMRAGLGDSPSRLALYQRTTDEIDAARRTLGERELQYAAARQTTTRSEDIMRFISGLIEPACAGDTEKRQQLRHLLCNLDYRITGRGEQMSLTVNGREFLIDPVRSGEKRYVTLRVTDARELDPAVENDFIDSQRHTG